MGILVESNGYDSPDQPSQVVNAVYFDRLGKQVFVQTGLVQETPVNLVRQRLDLPPLPDALAIDVDLGETRVSLDKIDSVFAAVQQSLALQFPRVSKVDPINAKVEVAPSIFYVSLCNERSTYAGGYTESTDGTHFQIHVALFYISFANGNVVVRNWKELLVFEAMNFYLMSIGRNDLTF